MAKTENNHKKSHKDKKKKKDKKSKSNGNHNKNDPNKRGMDVLLTKNGKHLNKGEYVRFTLIKGPRINRKDVPDPVNSSAPTEQFPLIAKFSESVIKPDFTQHPWKTGRLYQQDVPKAQIDSDEEEEEAKAVLANSKKRWKRGRRNDPPKRQWILQEEVDFLETMMNKRKKQKQNSMIDDANNGKNKLSSRYEGLPEHNPSHYILMHANNSNINQVSDHHDSTMGNATIQVTLVPNPPNVMINFAQPAARKTLTMSEAEQAIQDQRANMTRYMMHNNKQNQTFLAQQALANSRNKVSQSKARLMGKLSKVILSGGDDEEEAGDDVMGDVAFRERKGGGRARRELLTSLGDENVKVDDDGVLGGTNDDEFGGRRHFGRLKIPTKKEQSQDDEEGGGGKKAASGGGGGGGDSKEKGNAGMAMEDGFYQRDVQAEYEELDFDAAEQFDDDDVDVGETEVFVDTGGFAQDNDDDDDDGEEEIDMTGDNVSGAEGLASVAGFKAMLAKARGETSGDPNAAADGENAGNDANNPNEKKDDDGKNKGANSPKISEPPKPKTHLEMIMEAAKKAAKEAENKAAPAGNDSTKNGNGASGDSKKGSIAAMSSTTAPDLDENGLRVVSLDAVRKEIWLHHGSIQTKRLMKLFSIGKKASKERQNKFREVIKELCTMTEDAISGRMLVLKQHYSNMA